MQIYRNIAIFDANAKSNWILNFDDDASNIIEYYEIMKKIEKSELQKEIENDENAKQIDSTKKTKLFVVFDFQSLKNQNHKRKFHLFIEFDIHVRIVFSVDCFRDCCFENFDEICLRYHLKNDMTFEKR